MPKVNIGAGDFSGVEAAKGFSNYDGPVPPKGSYRCKTGLFRIVKNSNNDYMFKIIFEIAEPKGSPKAKYNGYAIWHNANLTEKSAPFVNAMLDALGLPRKAVWAGGIITDKAKPQDVLRIGPVTVKGIDVLVTTKLKEYPVGSGSFSLSATSFAKVEPVQESDDDEDAAIEGDPSYDDDAADDDLSLENDEDDDADGDSF